MNVDRDRDILLDHARRPRNSGRIEGVVGHCTNPFCGDTVVVRIQVSDQHIREIRIEAQGCSMAIASASLMTEQVKGRDVATASYLQELFAEAILDAPTTAWPDDLEQMIPLRHLRTSRARIPCALIGWHALRKALLALRAEFL
jgi:nitrogen fixation NifU-like protein